MLHIKNMLHNIEVNIMHSIYLLEQERDEEGDLVLYTVCVYVHKFILPINVLKRSFWFSFIVAAMCMIIMIFHTAN